MSNFDAAFEDLTIKKQKKVKYVEKLLSYLSEYKNFLLINIDNVGSKQLQETRMLLREKDSVMLMGKNTVIRKVLRDLIPERPQLEGVLNAVEGNMGFIFTNSENIKEVRDIITDAKIPAAAKANQFAPIDVIIPAGVTGLDPGQTSFFQALDIGTKITKGSIEILTNVKLILKGSRVSASAVALLSKLNIKPFFYGIVVPTVYEDGNVYSSAVLDLTEDALCSKFFNGVRKVAALSLAAGYPTLASVPHSISNAFKKLVAVAVETSYEFEEAKIYKEMLANPDAFKTAAPAAADSAAAAAPEPEEEEEEEEEEDMDFDLFD